MTFLNSRIRALLFGLPEDLAADLTDPLRSLCGSIESMPSVTNPRFAAPEAQVIFCTADTRIVHQLREARPDACIVVVTRCPEVSIWLDSIEAGATDYCVAPFEPPQLHWILEPSFRSAQLAA